MEGYHGSYSSCSFFRLLWNKRCTTFRGRAIGIALYYIVPISAAIAAPLEDVDVRQRNIQWRRKTTWWENLVIIMGYFEPFFINLPYIRATVQLDWVANTLVERNWQSARPCSLLVCGPLWRAALLYNLIWDGTVWGCPLLCYILVAAVG